MADLAWVEILAPSIAPAPAPAISLVSPASGGQGQTLSVVLTGSNFQAGASCSFGSTDITVNACGFNSSTQLTANITIGATAALGTRMVTVTNPDGQQATLSSGF